MDITNPTKSCRESGRIYAEALVEACGTVDPANVLTDTDDYPEIVKKVEQAEFIVGWFHGVAEACGVVVDVCWEASAPGGEPG